MNMRPVHVKSDLSRLLDTMQPTGPRRLPYPTTEGYEPKPTKLDEYGDERLNAGDHLRRRLRALAVIRHQNRHVMAFSLRAIRKKTPHKLGLYFGVSTDRGRHMAVVGHGLLLRVASVRERFPELVLIAEAETRYAMKVRKR